VTIILAVLFFRDNVLAYVGATFGLLAARPLVAFWSEPANFFRLNGLLLVILIGAVLWWMFLPARTVTSDES
jgi:hypothetical protein